MLTDEELQLRGWSVVTAFVAAGCFHVGEYRPGAIAMGLFGIGLALMTTVRMALERRRARMSKRSGCG